MPHPPAYCPNCQSIFPARAIQISGGAELGISNVLTDCPVCGFGKAQISEGIFRATNDAIELVSGPEFSRVSLELLRGIAERVASHKISQEQALNEAKAISPNAASILEKFFKFGVPSLALLVSLISLYLQYDSNKSSSIDSDRLYNAVVEQTYSLKKIAKQLKKTSNENRIHDKGARPTKPEAAAKAIAPKKSSNRRSEVKKKRREDLKKRWHELGRSRTH